MIDIAATIKEGMARIEADRAIVRESLTSGPTPPGLMPVDDQTFMAFVDGMQQQFPPEPIITPTGQTVVESPWILMLPYVDGGQPLLDRILHIREKGVL